MNRHEEISEVFDPERRQQEKEKTPPHHERSIAGKVDGYRSNIQNVLDPAARAQALIKDIEDLSLNLQSANLSHRTFDMAKIIPIAANIRSHNLVTNEGDTIAHLQDAIQELEKLNAQNGLGLPMSKITIAAAKLKEPGGLSKWVATIFPTLRFLHRSFTPSRAENLTQAAEDLRRRAT